MPTLDHLLEARGRPVAIGASAARRLRRRLVAPWRLEAVRGLGHRLVRGPLVGRARELDALGALARLHPWVAVVGPAGAGKSRLVEAWSATLARAPVHVDLQGRRGTLSAVAAIAGALDVHPDAAEILARLRQDPPVLVLDALDGFEPLVHELLERVPGLRIVATTREVREAPGVLELGPLALDDALVLYGEASDEARVALGRLERWPGSIELLAGAVHELGPRDLARGRLVTLDDVVGACWRRLPPRERDVLVATTAFAGPAPLDWREAGPLLARGLLHLVTGGVRAPAAVREAVASRRSTDAVAWLAAHAEDLDPRRHLDDLLVAARAPEVLEVLLALQWVPVAALEAALEAALDDLPPSPRSWRLTAKALRRQGREVEAEAALELARRAEEVA